MKKLVSVPLTAALIFGMICIPGCGKELKVESGGLTVNTPTSDSEINKTEEPSSEDPPVNKIPPPDYITNAKKLLGEEHGKVYIGMADLMDPNGYRYEDDPGTIHPASTIKAMVMEYAFLQVKAGNASLDEIVDGTTLLTLINQMIQVSCNESTGSIIARFGRAAIDEWLQDNYKHTRLYSDWRGYNHENKYNQTSVEDTVDFLVKLYRNKDEEPYDRMLEIMFGTTYSRDKIPAATADIASVKVANKTGSFVDGDDTADHDMAIVISYDSDNKIEFAYALVFYSFSPYSEHTYSAARPAIIAMARDIYEQVADFNAVNR
ncbi:MAG: class A beta-lactamase-related serine hydrolase [Oscillospiraceae bacterium]|nr:class A beta-lactamase-related serine hydrolase [Oscillospiraceae bacterium]